MLTTTFARLKEAGACESGYRKLGNALGGITAYGRDTPITLLQILESNGLSDTLWAFRAVSEAAEGNRIARLFACACAERVLPVFEKEFPDDKRPRQAIEVARRFVDGKATEDEILAAVGAAGAAAGASALAALAARDAFWAARSARSALAAAGASAWEAGWDARAAAGAAWVDERLKQERSLIELLTTTEATND